MEHAQQVLKELQSAADVVERGEHNLGTFVILSALYTEIVLAGVLKEEKRKMNNFNELGTGSDTREKPTAQQMIDFDAQVASVLEEICCIEKQIVAKIALGIQLRDTITPEPTQPGSCCSL